MGVAVLLVSTRGEHARTRTATARAWQRLKDQRTGELLSLAPVQHHHARHDPQRQRAECCAVAATKGKSVKQQDERSTSTGVACREKQKQGPPCAALRSR
jgi:hypothetical protein